MAPFDGSTPGISLAPPVLTLDGAHEHIDRHADWGPTRKRDLHSGLKSFARYLKIEDNHSIDLNVNAARIAAFAPAKAGIAKSTWATILSAVAAVIRSYQRRKKPSPKDLLPQWLELRGRLNPDDLRTLHGLSALYHFATQEGTLPNGINTAFFTRLNDHLRTETRLTPSRANAKFGQIIRCWNNAAKRYAFWPPAVQIDRPRKRVTVPWDRFPQSFISERDDWRSAMLQPGLLDDSSPDKPLAESTVATKSGQILRCASMLVANGFALEAVIGFAVLVEPRNFETALNGYKRRDGKLTPGLSEMAATMLGIARHWIKVPSAMETLLARAVRKVNCRKRGMTPKNRERLEQLLQPLTRAKLMLLPERLVAISRRQKNPQKAALRFQEAIAIDLLLVAPVRLGDLLRLRLRDHFSPSDLRPRAGGYVRLAIETQKNDVPVEFKIAGDRLNRLHEYVVKHLPLLAASTEVDKLFPGTSRGRGHKCEPALRNAIEAVILKHVGEHVHPHLFRHFAGALILKSDPGAHALVSRLLGHKSVQTTIDFYSGLETIWAAEAYHEILEEERSTGVAKLKQLKGRGRRRKS